MSTDLLFANEPTRITPKVMDDILVYCTKLKASDVTIQTEEPIWAEIYGKLSPITKRHLTNAEVSDILNAIYGPNGTTQLLTGTDVDTHYECRPSRAERYRFRVNGSACLVDGQQGIQLTLRTIPDEPPSLSSLNLEPEIVEAIAPDQGIVFVTGATGSGKSTLLASIVKELALEKDSNRKILTYESPIEFIYDSLALTSAVISQAEIPRHLPSFSAGIRNALRRKPHLILVGECRDQETIRSAIDAALTGHPVYTTLHSNGVAETLRRLVTSFPQAERHGLTVDLMETIRMIVWQRLVPSTDGKRIALREFLVFDETVRDALLNSDNDKITATTRALLKKYGQPMVIDAEKKFKAGLITERQFKLIEKGALSADRDAGS